MMVQRCVILAVMAASASVHAESARPAGTSSRPAAGKADRVDALVRKLGSRQWQEREDASARLKEMGTVVLEPLARTYRQTPQFEVRLRIRELASAIFQAERLEKQKGFLGISLKPVTGARNVRAGSGLRDARLRPDQAAIRAEQVIPGLPAEQAGMKRGDMIVEFNGKPVPFHPNLQETVNEFMKWIGDLTPGTPVELTVIRGNQTGRIRATLGARPLRYENDPEVLEAVRKEWQEWWARHFEPAAATTQSVD